MQPIGTHNYYVYIVTNKNKTVLYTGVTNSLQTRIQQHYDKAKELRPKSFVGKYNTYYLLHYERFEYINDAISREKEIKGWLRSKKEALINSTNPDWRFLNQDIGLTF